VAIEKPFKLTFTPENIKRSFELVGLHPYNPNAITPSMMAPSKATSWSAPLSINESSPIKRLKVALSDALELDAPAPPLPLLLTSLPSITPSPVPVQDMSHQLDSHTTSSSGPGPAMSARDLLSSTHAHWLVSEGPITSADRFEIFDTPPDSALHPPPIPNNPSNTSIEPDLTTLSPDELQAYTKSLLNHSHNLIDVLKAQRIQIGLDGMVIGWYQRQICQKEQRANRKGSLTTLTTIATDPVFIEVVKGIENATKMKKAKQEANQVAKAMRKLLKANGAAPDGTEDDKDGEGTDRDWAHAGLQQSGAAPALWCTKPMKKARKHYVRKGHRVNEALEEPFVLSTQAARPR